MHRQTRKMLLNMVTAIAVAAAAVLVFLPAAQAAPGYATANVNIRSGPGTTNPVIGTLVRGQQVDVQQCQGNWCYVINPGRNGWVSSSYLATGGTPQPSQPARPVQPNIDFGFSVGPDGPSFNFGIGTPGRPGVRPPPVREACFFTRSQYRGQSFCLERGESYDLGRWQGVGSIQNQSGLRVEVCTRFGFQNCRTYTTNASDLGNFGDRVDFVRVR